eukprot:m.358573 g.358573  ORF g.358573 m.358573 type:complete len:98 (+) comp55987_c0_seq30:1326-1619(+)
MISPLVAFAKRHRWQLELFIFVVVLSGGAVMLFPVARNFESLLAILVAMGVAGGAIVTLIPVLVADFIPQQDMSRVRSCWFKLDQLFARPAHFFRDF